MISGKEDSGQTQKKDNIKKLHGTVFLNLL